MNIHVMLYKYIFQDCKKQIKINKIFSANKQCDESPKIEFLKVLIGNHNDAIPVTSFKNIDIIKYKHV